MKRMQPWPWTAVLSLLLAATAAHAQFSDNFAGGPGHWRPFAGKWETAGGEYRQTVNDQYDQGSALIAENAIPTGRFTISVLTKALGGPAGGGLFWNMASRDGRGNCQMARVDPDFVIWGYEDAKGVFQQTGICNSCGVSADAWHTLAVAVDNELGKYNVLLDGKIVGRNQDLRFFQGGVGLQSSLANAFRAFEIRASTPAETEGLKINEPFNSPQCLAFGPGGNLYVTHRGRNAVAVVDPRTGMVLRSLALRGAGEMVDPGPIRIDGKQRVWVLDRASGRLMVFTDAGEHLQSIDVGASTRDFVLVEGGQLDAGAPGAWPKRDLVAIVTTDGTTVSVRPPDGSPGGTSVGPFKDVRALAIDRAGRILAGEAGDQTIRILAFRNAGPGGATVEPAGQITGWLNPRSIAVNSKNQIVHFGGLGYYEPWGAVRLIDQEGRRLSHFAAFSIGGFGGEGAIAVGPDDTVYVADTQNDRIVVVPPDFSEPRPHVETKGDTATISWRTNAANAPSGLAYTDPDGKTFAPPAANPTPDGFVTVTLTGLKPNAFYRYNISHAPVQTIPETLMSKRYSFLSAPPSGTTQVIRHRVITAIYLKTDNKGVKFSLPRAALGDRIPRMFARAREFYFRNSHLKVDHEIEYAVIENAEADIKDSIPPLEQVRKDIAASADFQGKNIANYDSVVAVWVGPRYKADQKEPLGRVAGPGLTPYGYSAFSAEDTLTWLYVHEVDHQMDAFFDRAGYPEFWLNHPDPTVHPGRYGGQFDVNAWIFREWPVNDWFWMPANGIGKVSLVADADGDGVPDDDPTLPLDEKRLGSSPKRVDTDGDGLDDLGEAMAGIFQGSNPRKADTDGDGIPDGRDPWPLDAAKQDRPRKTPVIDGAIAADEWTPLAPLNGDFTGQTWLNWDENAIYLAIQADRPFSAEVQLIPNNGGLFQTDKVEMRVEAPKPGDAAIRNGAGAFGRVGQENGKTTLELAFPRNPEIGLAPQMDQIMGLSIQVMDKDDRWLSVFEPWRLWQFRTTLR
ncbi:MAG TPA: hypothetical protein VGM37_15555 [Armatimonadota bacterium]|jgi:hypothetical protein